MSTEQTTAEETDSMPMILRSSCKSLALLVLATTAYTVSPVVHGADSDGDDHGDVGHADGATTAGKAFVDGSGPGFRSLTQDDFVNVNCNPDTWTWKDGTAYCTGKPTGVIRAKKQLNNFELVCQWRHMRDAGNSGIFIWGTPASLERLEAAKKPGLPGGIEVQVLDLGYAAQYEKRHKKPADLFTSHGDVFPVGEAKMKPFPPVAPDGARSFPSKNLSKGVGEWNHYYIRAINGEVRLWVNGEEVSGGTDCQPRSGFLCLESEGSPVEFKNIRLRELP